MTRTPSTQNLLKHPTDQLKIGLILYKGKNDIVVEYALRKHDHADGNRRVRDLETLPEGLKGSLPTVEEIEAELGDSDEPET